MFSDMDQEFQDAFHQEHDGWQGMQALLFNWLLYATSREHRTMLRIHRSPQLRRILMNFMTQPPVMSL